MEICGKLLIQLRREPPGEDKESTLMGLRKARQLGTIANVVCHVALWRLCSIPPPPSPRNSPVSKHCLLYRPSHTDTFWKCWGPII